MEAEAKDSEDELEGITARRNERKMASPPHSLLSSQEVTNTILNTCATKLFNNAQETVSLTMKTMSNQFSNPHETKNKHLDTENVRSSSAQNKIFSASTLGNKSPQNEARNVISHMRTTSPTMDTKSNTGSARRLSKFTHNDAFVTSSSLVQKANIETPNFAPVFCPKNDQDDSFSGKRKMGTAPSSFELQKMSQNNDVEGAFQELNDPPTKLSPLNNPPSKVPGRKSLRSKGKNVICDVPISNISTSEIKDLDAVQRSRKKYKETSSATNVDNRDVDMVENVIQSTSAVSSDIQKSSNQNMDINEQTGGSTSKSVRKKSISKKLSALNLAKKNTVNRKGSTFLKNSVLTNDDEKLLKDQNFKEVSQSVKSSTQIDLDDETEPPEDKDEASKEKHEDGEQENTVDVVMEEKSEGDQHNNVKDPMSIKNLVLDDKTDDVENPKCKKSSRGNLAKKGNKRPENTEESIPILARRSKRNVNAMEKSMELQVAEDVCNDPNMDTANADIETENVVNKKEVKRNKRSLIKTKDSVKEVTYVKAVNKKGKRISSSCDLEPQERNMQIHVEDQSTGKKEVLKRGNEFPEQNRDKGSTSVTKAEPIWFILAGHKLQRREFQQIIKRLKGRVCRVSHQWSYQATHFIVPDPIRRTEKFFAAAASGRWILKPDYLSASNQAGRFLAEEPFEWHKNGLSEDGQINLEAPRKWRLLKEKTGHGAFYGLRIIIYGECIAPPLDILKRVVKAGDGTILATSPPYTRFLNTGIDFAVVSPGMPHVDIWVQEFIKHEIPCVYADYLVEFVCKPGYSLERHVQFDTNVWAERSYNKLKKQLEEICEPSTPDSNDVACEVCGSRDRDEEMLICGDESGMIGCGVGTHIDCCDPPLEDVPEEDWFCVKCSKKPKSKRNSKIKGSSSRG